MLPPPDDLADEEMLKIVLQDTSDEDSTLTGSRWKRGVTKTFYSTCSTEGHALARRRRASCTR